VELLEGEQGYWQAKMQYRIYRIENLGFRQ
jgi:hypothetical protein